MKPATLLAVLATQRACDASWLSESDVAAVVSSKSSRVEDIEVLGRIDKLIQADIDTHIVDWSCEQCALAS
jgi:hypothetical protein